jgi:DNA-3-methyladenine glycosylase II
MRAVTGQQISVLAAERIWQRLLARLGRPSPDAVLSAGEEALAACGLTRRKAASLVAIAGGLATGAALPDSRDALLALPGVGPWTADMVAIFALGEGDIMPLGDVGLHRAIADRYGITRQELDRERLLALAEPWRPWRSIAVWYLWRDLDPVPVAY